MTGLSSQPKRRSILAGFMRGCREMTAAMCGPFEPKGPSARDRAESASRCAVADPLFDGLTLQSSADVVLLFRRMEILGLDSEELARSEPVKFRQMLNHCDRCESKGRCVQDIACHADQLGWHSYCPNYDALHGLRAQTA